jgi:C4-dicarboxylate-specific signal transduction histidine kinase
VAELKARLTVAEADYDKDAVAVVSDRLDVLREKREELRVPSVPARLGDQEDDYKRFRDRYRELTAALEAVGGRLAVVVEELRVDPPEVTATRRLQSNQSRLNARIDRYRKTIESQLNELRERWKVQAEADFKLYYQRAAPVIDDLQKGVRLAALLNTLDAISAEFEETFAERYEPFMRTLEQLRNNVDLDGALAVTEDERAQLDRRVNDFNVLAQLGIAVEIIGHELETMDQEVRRNLARLPADVQRSEAYKLAYEAHRALADRLRFLAPLRLAGYRTRETITGEYIARFLIDFFGKRIRDERVVFEATPAFRSIRVTDLRSRLLPVFINLVNNALYWVRFVEDRRISLDRVGELVVVADSGPGVDEHDLPHLFELFFTRRTSGRGVGLHLCRINLAVAHHTIRYADREDPHVLPGANFIIEFRGLVHD